ncbi:beta-galactosidase [Thermaerobacter composti]|uniref:Beta-galactosidase n=1 Tax=Thermaerobacter composti TaxID=554949 RepID=A0ABZ0QL80_9FIRM|nr:beta-galactosidase [Thermaerobacter composti]WPD18251.1 beta-galactosidase [Thermaerobacter composti]
MEWKYKVPHILFGGDYNPEQWSEEVWKEDVRLMKQAGVNIVTLGVFSWALLQPGPDRYDFNWMDRIIDLLWKHGIYVNLATPTASPPAWMAVRYPEMLPMDENGVRYSHGSRQHYCPNSRVYREYSERLVRRLAEHYKDHPALAMWHVHNEYGCHISRCFCPNCEAAFRKWLRQRYGHIDVLNERWGTAFWGQTYYDWDEIPLPRNTPTYANPALQLDYARFMSDSLLACYLAERRILKQITPDVPVTTNLMGFFKPLDYFAWAEHMDLVSWDSYPEPTAGVPILAAMSHDLMRSLKKGQPFILMEQTPSQVNWRPQNPLKRPGIMRLWSYQTLAHGSDGILFFQWRASRAGAEKFHGAMVPHAGEKTRVYREVAQLGAELKRLDEVLGSRIIAEVAIAFDWSNWWALELDSKPSRDIRYLDELLRYYRPLFERNIAVDFVPPTADLSRYKLVLAPSLYMLTEDAAANLAAFVRRGGYLLTTFFSGIVDENDRVYLGGYPALLKDVLGIWVEEFDPFLPGQRVTCRRTVVSPKQSAIVPERFTADLWADIIHLEGAQVLAEFAEDFYAGYPAITVHRYGRGQAVYVGTRPEDPVIAGLLKALTETAGVKPVLEVPSGVEATCRRTQAGRSYWFLLNHTEQTQRISLPRAHGVYRNLLTNEVVTDELVLAPRDVAVLRTETAE